MPNMHDQSLVIKEMKIKHHCSLTKLAKLKEKLASINQRNWCSQSGMLAGSFLEALGQYFKKFE